MQHVLWLPLHYYDNSDYDDCEEGSDWLDKKMFHEELNE